MDLYSQIRNEDAAAERRRRRDPEDSPRIPVRSNGGRFGFTSGQPQADTREPQRSPFQTRPRVREENTQRYRSVRTTREDPPPMRTPYVRPRHFDRPESPPEMHPNLYQPHRTDIIEPWHQPRFADVMFDFVLRVAEVMLSAGFQEAAWFWGERRRFYPPGYQRTWNYNDQ